MAIDETWPLDGRVKFVKKLVSDYCKWAKAKNLSEIPTKKLYRIISSSESDQVVSSARKKALSTIYQQYHGLKKFALDTRRIDQENQNIPRKNLQYYNRSQQYVDAEANQRLSAFAELLPVLENIQQKYGNQPEYFNSYVSQLYDLVHRVVQIKNAELNVFRPQICYLEQLLYARYRLSIDDLKRINKNALEERILSKDESLLKRGQYLAKTTSPIINQPLANKASLEKDGNTSMQENLVNAIFGNNQFRRDGEKTVERTITITIRDDVIE